MAEISPLAPKAFPDMPSVAGVRLSAVASGIRYRKRKDLLLVELAKGATLAGVFTRSLTAAAPVEWCRALRKRGTVRAVVVNAGNANAFTGRAGLEAVKRTAAAVAKLLDCRAQDVFVASTGVIGVPLPDDKIRASLPALVKELGPDRWHDAAEAIMTTDTFPKAAARTAAIGGVEVKIAGIAKGSGMIAPDMATMLAFIFTDAKIPASVLQAALEKANTRSFNSITVDGDTSTNDSVLLCATGRGPRHRPITRANDPHFRDFRAKLQEVMVDLAQQIVRDGEGASKFVTVRVTGAASEGAARRIGLAIANSPLVKTAIAGADANWGRIVMAVGKSGEKADRDKLKVAIGGILITDKGSVIPTYDETPVAQHMKGDHVLLEVDVGVGRGAATVWTCDLTHGYIRINTDYRS